MMPDCTSLTLDQHLAPAGASAESFARLWAGLWRQRRIPPDLLEACRLTFARLHDDVGEMAAVNPAVALSAAAREAVLAGRTPDDPAYAAALLFAEYYWLDAQAITDEAADAVKAHYGEPGLVLLIEALGLIDGRIRAARCLRDLSTHASSQETAHA